MSEYIGEDAEGISVFLSYAREDGPQAEHLRDRLISDGFDAYLDTHDVSPGEPWKERLAALIEAADVVVFLISPASIRSYYCDWEINEAERLRKRLLPVILCDPLDTAPVPGRLRRLNYIFLRDQDDRKIGYGQLVSAARVDIAWVREHTRLLKLANDWQNAGQVPDHLLRGEALVAAERWLLQPPAKYTAATLVHRDFIVQSRADETARLEAQRQQIARAQRFQRRASWALIGVAMLLCGATAASILQARATAVREDIVLTSLAQRAYDTGSYDRAMRIAAHGLPPRGALPFVDPWSKDLEQLIALSAGHTPNYERAYESAHLVDETSQYMVIAIQDEDWEVKLSIWDRILAKEVITLPGVSAPLYLGANLSLDQTLLLGGVENSSPEQVGIWRVQTGEEIFTTEADGALLSPDGNWVAVNIFSGEVTERGELGVGSDRLMHIRSAHRAAVLSNEEYWALQREGIFRLWSPTSDRLFFGEPDHPPTLWALDSLEGEAKDIKSLYDLDSQRLLNAQFDPSGSYLVTLSTECGFWVDECSGSTRLVVWSARTGDHIADLLVLTKTNQWGRHEIDFTFRDDGQRLAVWGRGRVREGEPLNTSPTVGGGMLLYDLEAGREILRLTGNTFDQSAFSNDGTRIYVGQVSEPTQVFNATSGESLIALKDHGGRVAFGPDQSDRMLSFDQGGASLIRYSDGTTILDIPDQAPPYFWSDDSGVQPDSPFEGVSNRFLLENTSQNSFEIRNSTNGTLILQQTGVLLDWRGPLVLALVAMEGTGENEGEEGRSGEYRVIDTRNGTIHATIPTQISEFGYPTGRLDDAGDYVMELKNDTLRVWGLKWFDLEGQDLRDAICAEKLVGRSVFTEQDVTDPALAGLGGRDPCQKTGLLSMEFWSDLFSPLR